VAHEVTNGGNDTAHLSNIAGQTKAALGVEKLEAIADRGYFDGEEILACDQAGITVTPPKPQKSGAKSKGRFGKQDFVYLADENVYRCPAGEKLKYRFTAEEHGQKLHRYWTDACHTRPIKAQCTAGRERRITRWEHEEVVEAVQERLDKKIRTPCACGVRRSSIPSARSRCGWDHALLDEDAAQGCHRDGVACARLQLDTCTEYLRRQADAGGGRGVKRPDFAFLAVDRALTLLGAASVCVADENGKNMLANVRASLHCNEAG
jgi:hypothetical protein